MPRLLRLTAQNPVLSVPWRPPMPRVVSPLGGSTLTTSAPRSPSSMVQNGPAITCVKSRTRIPASACFTISPHPNESCPCLQTHQHIPVHLGRALLVLWERGAKPTTRSDAIGCRKGGGHRKILIDFSGGGQLKTHADVRRRSSVRRRSPLYRSGS